MNNILKNLSKWLSSEIGNAFYQAFLHEWEPIKTLLCGKQFLQLGVTGKNTIFNGNTTVMDFDFKANIYELPFATDCFDGIFIPFLHHKYKSLDNLYPELNRVIKPGGVVVFLGFNAITPWGMKFLLQNNYSHQSFIIRHNMQKLGFELFILKDFFSIPGTSNKKWLKVLSLLNKTGILKIFLPAGFYCLVLKKTVENPIKLAYDTAILMP
jgi:SAM-dependent methyltransferase